MKILLDTCVWGKAKAELILAGHDVIWGGDWQTDPGDSEILTMALNEKRVLITLDKDFGELAIIKRIPHHGILRLVNIPARSQAAVCARILEKYSRDLENGAIVTSDGHRIRIRPPED
ncbi:MAG: DUF5615 family PIN-like protein [Deltaproteobacteria bacterium]|nr:DUF5615 family PIN-like protein [Deltaproteobacteria bacterium]